MPEGAESYKDKETLRRLYVEEKETQQEIANRYDTPRRTIGYWVKKYGLKEERDSSCPYKDGETLERLYWGEGLTQAEIGERFGVHRHTIGYWLDVLDVGTRTRSEAARNRSDQGTGITMQMVHGYPVAKDPSGERVYIHRLVAVSEYGYDAVKDKHVHHKNGVTWQNSPSNLRLVSPSEHAKLHSLGKATTASW